MFIDTHCHLDPNMVDDDVDQIIKRAKKQKVEKVITVGIDYQSSQDAVELAQKYNEVYAAVGVHPNDCQNADDNWQKKINNLAQAKEVVAIGETGVDVYRNRKTIDRQKRFFRNHIDIAKNNNLPVIVHNRKGDEVTANILEEMGSQKFVLHCYGSGPGFAKKMVKKGAYFSFTGNITYGDEEKERALKNIPLDKIMLETDSPFLSPQKVRNKTNEPAHIPYIAEKIAELKDTDTSTIEEKTTRNAQEFFGI